MAFFGHFKRYMEPQPVNVERFGSCQVFSWKNRYGSFHSSKAATILRWTDADAADPNRHLPPSFNRCRAELPLRAGRPRPAAEGD